MRLREIAVYFGYMDILTTELNKYLNENENNHEIIDIQNITKINQKNKKEHHKLSK